MSVKGVLLRGSMGDKRYKERVFGDYMAKVTKICMRIA
jgi:hypothetical protein